MHHLSASSALCFCLLSCSLGACAQPGVRAWAHAGNLELDGGLNTSSGSSASVDSLGLGGEEIAVGAGVEFDWEPLHVSLESVYIELAGQGVADGALEGGPGGARLGEGFEVGEHLLGHALGREYSGEVLD